MFDIGWSELLVIGVVALIAIGPKELPGVLRALGQWTAKIRRMAAEFQNQFQDALREAEMADLKKQVDDLNEAARSITRFDPLADHPAPARDNAPYTPEPPAVVDAGSAAPAVSPDPAATVPDSGTAPVQPAGSAEPIAAAAQPVQTEVPSAPAREVAPEPVSVTADQGNGNPAGSRPA